MMAMEDLRRGDSDSGSKEVVRSKVSLPLLREEPNGDSDITRDGEHTITICVEGMPIGL